MKKSDTSGVGALAITYEDFPILRALLSLVPGWSAADTLLLEKADEIKKERLRVFFDELARNPERLNKKVVQSHDFVHCFLKTTEAVLKTRQEEKLRHFARLLGATTMPGAISDIDEFEDLLDILFSTSTREMAALILLSQYEHMELQGEEAEANKRLIEYWPRFRAEAIDRLAIHEAEFPGFMSRLERTSLYTSSLGMMWGSTGEGRTTPQFARLAALVLKDKDLKGAETSVL